MTTAVIAAAAAAAINFGFSPAQTSLHKPPIAEVHETKAAFKAASITRMEDVHLEKKRL